MITKFQIFEKEGDKFSIGTWILLDDPEDWRVYPYAKIIDRDSTKTHNDSRELPKNDYEVKTFYKKTGEERKFWVDDVEITRELTPEEIEEAKMFMENPELYVSQNKYNI